MKPVPLLAALGGLFEGRERWLLAGVAVVSLLAAIIETIGVAAILPFMVLILDPEGLTRFPILTDFAAFFGAETTRAQIVFFGVLMVTVVAVGNLISALNIYVQQMFAAHTQVRLADWMFAEYVKLPYAFHVQRDMASVVKVMMGDTGHVVGGIVGPLTVAFGKGAVALGIVVLLFIHDPVLSLTISAVLLIAYSIVYLIVRSRQQILGEETNRNNLIAGRTAMETLAGIKELLVLGRERLPLSRFRVAYGRLNRAQALNATISSLPRFVLETIAFAGIFIVTVVMVLTNEDGAAATIPTVALYGFAAYRLLPALQQVFGAVVGIKFYRPALDALHADLDVLRHARAQRASEDQGGTPERVAFERALELRDVTFTYEGAVSPALTGINLTIKPNESIGLVGRTGAGKTTLSDIILGLYQPDDGEILVDGQPLTGARTRAWQRQLGFVPQQVFLRNASIKDNIAFGFAPEEISHEAVVMAARRAQAEEFIVKLPESYQSEIGAAGVKISGGQRQRLGIARALYHEPEILVFDEATSALDGLTEDAVMEAIKALRGERTVILIAHRLRTVEACDRIIMLDEGRIVADGSYQELLRTSPEFQHFVGRR